MRKVKVWLIGTCVSENLLTHETSVTKNIRYVGIVPDVSKASSVVNLTLLLRRRGTVLRVRRPQGRDRQLSVQYYHPSPPIPRMKLGCWSFG
jgi:hypothetical protein